MDKKSKCYLFGIQLGYSNRDPAKIVRVYRYPKTQMADECFEDARQKVFDTYVKDQCTTAQIISMSPIE